MWDKRAAAKCSAGRGNQLWAYVDKPRQWDAWDIDAGYAEEGAELRASGPPEVVEAGPHRAAVRVERAFRDSRIVQEVRLWAGLGADRFRDPPGLARPPLAGQGALPARRPLRLARPSRPRSAWSSARPTATPPGSDARFEVAGHRFADLSEPGYGAALLNDGRYGHHALGSELGLSLLRSPIWPDPLADEGVQDVIYALYPHAGQWLEGGVLAEAEDLNRPLLVHPVSAAAGRGCARSRSTACRSALGTLKALEDGGGLVLRAYEPHGARGTARLALPDALDARIRGGPARAPER